jgi:hypothetical protein
MSRSSWASWTIGIAAASLYGVTRHLYQFEQLGFEAHSTLVVLPFVMPAEAWIMASNLIIIIMLPIKP